MEMNTTFLIVQNVEVRQTWKCRPRKLHQIVMQYVLFLKYCCENKKIIINMNHLPVYYFMKAGTILKMNLNAKTK